MRVTIVTRGLRALLVAVLAAFALVVYTPSGAGAETTTAPCQRTISSGAVDVPIPDESFAASVIDVPEDGLVVSDLDVRVDVHHTDPRDLDINLISFTDDAKIRVSNTLFHQDGGTNIDNILGVVFDDDASTPISWADAPYTGRFRPTRPLAVHDGASGGRFQLLVTDEVPQDSGTLNDWSLIVTYRSCDFDGDRLEDHVDRCRDLTASTATGCPVTSRAVTAKYGHGKFRGALSSPVAGCEAGRAVSVFKVRRGADARVGIALTRADGSWRLAKAKKRGRYYATSVRVAVPDRAECPAVQSRTFRIR